jgi:predicted TIM-barrel fold metal-dependent hydrolase
MRSISGLKLLRILAQRTLADIGKEIGGYRRAHLSHVERDPSEAGPKLRKKLERLHGAGWTFLSKDFDGVAIAASIVKQYEVKTNV